MPTKPTHGQEALLVVSEQTGLVQPRNFAETEPGVAINVRIEQKIHLMNSLGYLAAAKIREGTVAIGPYGELAERYGEQASAVVEGAARNIGQFKVLAGEEFRRAVAEPTLIDAGVLPIWRAKRITDTMFAKFFSEYYKRPTSNKESITSRKQLETEVRDLQNRQTVHNRTHKLRPHKMAERVRVDHEPPKDALLDTPGRMLAIQGDIRAGFLPRSNAEKNIVITYLDYLDNPEYPLGVTNQLFEVMGGIQKFRQPKPGKPAPKQWGVKDAIRAIESIVWQIGDYYADATRTITALESLNEAIYNASPKVLVHELEGVGKQHEGILQLIRSINIETFVKDGKIKGPTEDPLAGTVHRTVDSSDRSPGRHKTMHDQYTRPDRAEKTPDFDAYLQERIATLTVREARKSIGNAVQTETMRSHFMWQRLLDVQVLEQKPSMKPVMDAAQLSLHAFDVAA